MLTFLDGWNRWSWNFGRNSGLISVWKTSCLWLSLYALVHLHTASSWNIIIQWTSHDDLTEKTVLPKPPMKWWWWIFFFVKWQKLKLHFVIWQKNCLCLTSLDDQIFKSFWKPNPWMNLLEFFFLLYQFLLYFLQFKSFPPWMACFN